MVTSRSVGDLHSDVSFLENSLMSQRSLVLGSVNVHLHFVAFNFMELTLEVVYLLFEVVALILESLDGDVVVEIIMGSVLVLAFVLVEFLSHSFRASLA